MKKLLMGLSGTFAAIPGLAVIATGLGAPPKLAVLFGGMIEAFGALTLLLIWVNREAIRAMPSKRVSRFAVAFGVLALVALITYVGCLAATVIGTDERGVAYVPLWASGNLASLFAAAGGRNAAVIKYGIDAVLEAVASSPTIAVAGTTALMIILYQAVFSSMTAAFGLLAIHSGSDLSD